jgi:DNA-binding NarL/FixJ family response regulator
MPDIRVIIVEDDFYARDALAQRVQRDPQMRVIAEPETPEQALELLAAEPAPQLMLIDLDFPGEPDRGLRLVEQARGRSRDLLILCLTLEPAPEMIPRLVDAGVDGIMMKNECRDGLMLAIEGCVAGDLVITRSIAPLLSRFALKRPARVIPDVSLPEDMSPRLRTVAYMRYIRGLTPDQIAEELVLSSNTVDGYLREIKAILRLDRRHNLPTRGFYNVTRGLWRGDDEQDEEEEN